MAPNVPRYVGNVHSQVRFAELLVRNAVMAASFQQAGVAGASRGSVPPEGHAL